MQQHIIIGNRFQTHMQSQFDVDINSTSVSMSKVKGRENYVYGYIIDMAHLFQPVKYGLQANPSGLYANYDTFKKHFVRYWRNALGIPTVDSDKLRDIFDSEVSSQESCRNRVITSVFFENGKALAIDDCLSAVYEVLKIA